MGLGLPLTAVSLLTLLAELLTHLLAPFLPAYLPCLPTCLLTVTACLFASLADLLHPTSEQGSKQAVSRLLALLPILTYLCACLLA